MASAKSNAYQANLQRRHELELARINGRAAVQRDIMRYVAEDFRSQLLLVAVSGMGVSALLDAYEKYQLEKEKEQADYESQPITPDTPPPKPPSPLWVWLLTGGAGGFLGGAIVSQLDWSQETIVALKESKNPYTLIGSLASGSKSVSELAWAALFASILMGDGGIGGLTKNLGGTGSDALQTAAMAGV